MSNVPYKTRTRFAWLPVRLWARPTPFTHQLYVWAWWCDVSEIQTILGEWVAYIHHQGIKEKA